MLTGRARRQRPVALCVQLSSTWYMNDLGRDVGDGGERAGSLRVAFHDSDACARPCVASEDLRCSEI